MTTALRVLHVDSSPEYRGGQRQLLLLATGQAHSGLQVRCLVRSPRLVRALTEAGVVVSGWRGPAHPLGWAQLWRACRGGPVILHAHDSRSHGALRLLAPARLQSKLVVHRRIDDPPRLRRITRWKYRAGHIISVSHAVDAVMERFGIPSQRRSVQYSAVPAPLEPKERASDGASADEDRAPRPLRLLTVGALVPHKGHAVLIEALSLMSESSELLLLGDGPLGEQLTGLADDLGVGARFTLEPWDGAAATALRATSDLYVQPSLTEGLGTAVIDAMVAGLPVVATAVGGLTELVGPSCGWLVPPDDPAALALQLDQLARALRETPAEVTPRVVAARSRVQSRHSPEQMIAGVGSVYDGIL